MLLCSCSCTCYLHSWLAPDYSLPPLLLLLLLLPLLLLLLLLQGLVLRDPAHL
jgi:hypothetical protein